MLFLCHGFVVKLWLLVSGERDVCFMFVEMRLTKFIIPHYKVDVFNVKWEESEQKFWESTLKWLGGLFSQIWHDFENFKL